MSNLVIPASRERDIERGTDALSIREAPKRAELFIDPATNALKDDSVPVPMGDRVLVRRIPEAVRTIGGITLPETGKSPAGFGVVVGVGQGRYNLAGQLIPVRVCVGAVIAFGKYAGTDVHLFGVGAEDGKCVSLREEEIMFVVMSRAEAANVQAVADPPISPVRRD